MLDAAAHALGRPLQLGRGGLREGVVLELGGALGSSIAVSAVARAHRPPKSTSTTPALYFNRELSWLDFNDRVLQLAEDPERAAARARSSSCAICGDNLDEFFMIRVAGLHDQVDAGLDDAAARRPHAAQTIDAIRGVVAEQQRAPGALLGTSCARRSPSTASGSSACDDVSDATSASASTSASGARSSRS